MFDSVDHWLNIPGRGMALEKIAVWTDFKGRRNTWSDGSILTSGGFGEHVFVHRTEGIITKFERRHVNGEIITHDSVLSGIDGRAVFDGEDTPYTITYIDGVYYFTEKGRPCQICCERVTPNHYGIFGWICRYCIGDFPFLDDMGAYEVPAE